MPPLSQSVHEEMTRRLQLAREETLRALRARTHAEEGDAPAIGPLAHEAPGDDQVGAEMISHNEEQFAGRETALLHEIDVALGKLEAGGAGICESCGCEIPDARLLATPTVRLCIPCQEQLEKDQRGGRGPTM